MVCAHFETLEESLLGNLVALKHKPTAIELMDDKVMDAAKQNIEQNKNRFFVKGEPGAMLMIEFSFETEEELNKKAADTGKRFQKSQILVIIFHWLQVPIKLNGFGRLRTAGLGLLANIPGDRKGVPGIEDTAVHPEYLARLCCRHQKSTGKAWARQCILCPHCHRRNSFPAVDQF